MMTNIWSWSTTAATNATADSGINWAENQAASTVNDSARVMMKRIRELLNDLGGVNTSGGTGNAQTLTATSGFAAYTDGLLLAFVAGNSNSGATTLNANAVGAKSVYANGAVLSGGEIASGGLYVVAYDTALNGGAGGWHLVNPKHTSSTIANVPAGNISATTIQAAINELDTEKQPLDATLTALAGVTVAADTLIYATGADSFTTTTFSAFGRTIVDDADAAAVRTTIGAQASGATLSSLEGLTLNAGDILYATAADTLADLAIGTAKQQLTVNAGATAPEWVSPGWQVIAAETNLTTGGASTTLSVDFSVYEEVVLMIDNLSASGSGVTNINVYMAVTGTITSGFQRTADNYLGGATQAAADRFGGIYRFWQNNVQIGGSNYYVGAGRAEVYGWDASTTTFFSGTDGLSHNGTMSATRPNGIVLSLGGGPTINGGVYRIIGRRRSF